MAHSEEMIAHYENLEKIFSSILESEEINLSESEFMEVKRFLDVDEFGIALDTLVGIIIEEHKYITPAIVLLILQLASLMELDDNSFVDKLNDSRRREP